MQKFWSGNVLYHLGDSELGDYLMREYIVNGQYVAIRDYGNRAVVEYYNNDYEFKSLGEALDRLDREATKAKQVREF